MQTIGDTENIGHDFLLYIYKLCETPKYWWQKPDFVNFMNPREMLAPTNTSQDNLKNINLFNSTFYSSVESDRKNPLYVLIERLELQKIFSINRGQRVDDKFSTF